VFLAVQILTPLLSLTVPNFVVILMSLDRKSNEDFKNVLQSVERRRRILRRIVGSLNENEIWRRRYNHEIYQLFNEAPISDFLRGYDGQATKGPQ